MADNKKSNTSIKLNFIMNAILTMSTFIFPLITFPYISRILTATGTGKVSFATSLISYFLLLSQLGIPTYGIRACAIVRDNKEKLSKAVHEIFIINLVMTIVSYLFFAITLVLIPRLQVDRNLYIIISCSILFNTLGMEWLYKALEQYKYITIRSIIFKFIAVIMMFIFVKDVEDYVIYGGISIFASSASYILNFIHVRKYIYMKPLKNYEFAKHFKAILIFFAMSCAITIYTNLDAIMLGFMKTDTDVGYYSAAVKIKNILLSIVASVGTVLLPRVSYYIENKLIKEFHNLTKKAMLLVIITAIPLAVYFMIFAKEGIRFISGSTYDGAILPMMIIMPTLFFVGMTNIMGTQTLVPLGKEKKVLYSTILGAVVDLILNFILIPEFGATGAALGTLVAEIIVFAYQYVCLKDIVSPILKEYKWGKLIISVILASIFAISAKVLNYNEFIILLISAMIFFGVYLLILTLFKEEMTLNIEKQIFEKIKNILKKGE